MSDATSMELARKKQIDQAITKFYEKYFHLPLRIKMQVGEVGSNKEAMEQFQAQKRVEELEVIEKMMSEVDTEIPVDEEQGDLRLQMGYDIKEPAVPMQEIQDEEKKVTLQGSVFGLDRKELRNGNTLFTFYLTDFTDSMQMKMFAKTKEDVKILSLLANGKWVKVRGRVEYDRFMQIPELAMIPSDLIEVKAPPDRKDNAPEKRVEFHLHSTMSTMDAVTSIDQYVKMAARVGT